MKTIGGSLVSALTTTLSLCLIVIGLLFVYDAQQVQGMSLAPVQTNIAQTSHDSAPSAVPTALSIPNAKVELNVQVGAFDAEAGQWQINDHDAFYAVGTATPIIYAHNKNGMFVNLRNVREGDELRLSMSDGSPINYVYQGVRLVKSNDARVLMEKNDKTIILLTCEGMFNESRRLVYFVETSP